MVENLYTRPILEDAFASLTIERLEEHDSEIDEGPAIPACEGSST